MKRPAGCSGSRYIKGGGGFTQTGSFALVEIEGGPRSGACAHPVAIVPRYHGWMGSEASHVGEQAATRFPAGCGGAWKREVSALAAKAVERRTSSACVYHLRSARAGLLAPRPHWPLNAAVSATRFPGSGDARRHQLSFRRQQNTRPQLAACTVCPQHPYPYPYPTLPLLTQRRQPLSPAALLFDTPPAQPATVNGWSRRALNLSPSLPHRLVMGQKPPPLAQSVAA